jgi:hypothetical protein
LIRFQDRTAVGKYNALMADIKQRGIDQEATQKRLAGLLSQSTTWF